MRPPRSFVLVRFFRFSTAPIALSILLALTFARASLAQAPADLTADASAWRCMPSDGVEATILADTRAEDPRYAGPAGAAARACLRLDFNFKTGGGFVVVQRDLALDLPENYEFSFNIRAADGAKRNNLEFKLLDPGQPTDPKANSVWWVIKRGMEFPAAWTPITYKKRHFSFAWGPSGGTPLTKLAHVEFAISSSQGGKGSIWFDGLTFRELPPVKPYTGTPITTATGSADVAWGPENAIDGNATTAWHARAPGDSLIVDFGQAREFGGLRLAWNEEPANPSLSMYCVEISSDGTRWITLTEVRNGSRRLDHLYTPDSEARYVRIAMARGASDGPSAALAPLAELSLIPIDQAKDRNTFIATVAKDFPRGRFPHWAYGEQSFWTVLGVPGDTHEALINEEGQIEVDKGAFSLEPFVIADGKVLTWADGTHTQSLRDGHLPIAVVTREMKDAGLRLTITAAASGPAGESVLAATYELSNTSNATRDVDLAVALRPYQVNPPSQFLNMEGGVSHIARLDGRDGGFVVDGSRVVIPCHSPAEIAFWQVASIGEIVDHLGIRDADPAHVGADDPDRCASGAFVERFHLAPGASATLGILTPFSGTSLPAWFGRKLDEATLRGLFDVTARLWTQQLAPASLSLPPSASAIENTFYAQQAYILINKDGPGFQPGSRSYERSWMRDGSMTSAAMLQLGHTQEAKDFLAWYASHQFPDGKVPCVVDSRGPDPVPENDSHGQLIMAFANYHRYTKDTAFVREQFEHVRKAVDYIQLLRAQRTTGDYDADSGKTKQEPGKPPVPLHAMHGLMPESISHEGYSAKPMSSYWDDLFTYRGLKDAAYLAGVIGDTEHELAWKSLAKGFAQDLVSSYEIAMKTHAIDYLPGCVELGDFDATSTTVALWPVQAQDILPAAALRRTFEKYWEFFRDRRDHPRDKWEAYTPYEWRCVNAMVHLGMKRQALEALDWFFLDQYPPGWRHWAEVVWSNPRTPKFIGDMPHTWVGSDFLNALRSLLVYEDEATDSLVLLAGVPEKWLSEGDGLAFHNFRTYYGTINVDAKADAKAAHIAIAGDAAIPAGGFVVRCPLDTPSDRVTLNGKPANAVHGSIVVRTLPAEIEWQR